MRKGNARHGAGTYGARRAAPGACSHYASSVTPRCVSRCVAVVALAMACGHRPAAPPPLVPVSVAAAPLDRCVLTADSSVPPPTLDIAVPDVAHFVRRQVYETLIRLDCAGSVLPGLAQSWASAEGGRRWAFTIRPGTRFSDGVPLTAADVFAALTRDSSLLDHGAVTLESIDRVSARFPEAFAGVPPLFADPALAVWRPGAPGDGVRGSGSARVDTVAGVATVTPLGPGRPTVTVRSSAGGDARDLLDHGIDILVSGDPEVLSYAAGKSDLQTVPLPWDRVYVLLSSAPPGVADTVRASLARDVVRTDARPAGGRYWWLAGPACPASDTVSVPPVVAASSAASVVFFQQDDAPARGLAERLVALGFLGQGGRASGIAPPDFDARFGAGGDAYLVSLPRDALAPCRAVADLVAHAPWLSNDPSRHITALVETRQRAIVRRGGTAFTVDWDGTLRLR